MGRIFALVDCNNFYASCERVFQPGLGKRPVAVLSNNDGCVVARSNEVKALGIPMGAPWHEHREVFERNGVAVFSSNYLLYGDMSERVMSSLGMLAPDIEVYSIDEAFLRLDGFGNRDLAEMALDIRAKVLQWMGDPDLAGRRADQDAGEDRQPCRQEAYRQRRVRPAGPGAADRNPARPADHGDLGHRRPAGRQAGFYFF